MQQRVPADLQPVGRPRELEAALGPRDQRLPQQRPVLALWHPRRHPRRAPGPLRPHRRGHHAGKGPSPWEGRFRRGRVDAVVAAARPYLPGADRERREREWTGPRAMPPTDCP
ncbi:hypothetical protein [Streptomyces sp. NPDC020362]|uniref:hypothetical protein n=1 Tax=unclassified Streptomyces TaxID=2593676 RepID=UPI0033D7239F